MDGATAFILFLIVGPFLLCLLLQYGAGRIKAPRLRRGLSWPLPLLWGGALLLSFYKITSVTGWGRLLWEVLAYLSLSALAGTGLGWLLGKRKE